MGNVTYLHDLGHPALFLALLVFTQKNRCHAADVRRSVSGVRSLTQKQRLGSRPDFIQT